MEYTASDGVRLFLHRWEATGEPQAALLVLHGVGEHGGRYDGLARRLAERGVTTLAFDHRGHGRSGGHRGHVDRWARYLEDGGEFAAHLGESTAGLPLFVYGHSMGSLICLGMAIEVGAKPAGEHGVNDRGVRGWIVSGASIDPVGLAKPHLVAIARLLSSVAPRVSLDLGIAAAALSHAPDVVQDYLDDPLVQKRATVRWGAEALDAIADIKARADAITDPLLILHGGDDPLSRADGSRWLAGAVSGEATLRVYEGALHEPHNEPDFGDAAGDIGDWIDRHVRV